MKTVVLLSAKMPQADRFKMPQPSIFPLIYCAKVVGSISFLLFIIGIASLALAHI